MLVLSRKLDQTVHIVGKDISIHVLNVQSSSVRLGFVAPKEVKIVRGELLNEREKDARPAQLRISAEARDQLQATRSALEMYRKERAAGLHSEAEVTFARILDQMDSLTGGSSEKARVAHNF